MVNRSEKREEQEIHKMASYVLNGVEKNEKKNKKSIELYSRMFIGT
jgi:hypothetical protein